MVCVVAVAVASDFAAHYCVTVEVHQFSVGIFAGRGLAMKLAYFLIVARTAIAKSLVVPFAAVASGVVAVAVVADSLLMAAFVVVAIRRAVGQHLADCTFPDSCP